MSRKDFYFSNGDIESHIDKAKNAGNFVEAVLVSHMYVEIWLREIVKIACKLPAYVWEDYSPSEDVLKETRMIVDKMNFVTLIESGLIMGLIELSLYKKLCDFNTKRNNLGHKLFKKELPKEILRSYAEEGLELIKKVGLLEMMLEDEFE